MNRESLLLLKRSMNRQIFNPTVVKHRQFDCHVATAKLCGTHWVKYMLSLVLCKLYDLPYPENIIADTVVGHTKTPPRYDHIPQVAVTHSHGHYLLHVPHSIRILRVPKIAVLVRDPRDIMVSVYEKTKGEYLDCYSGKKNVCFEEYLRGDPTGKVSKKIEDIWGLILFFNSWSSVLRANSDQTLLMKYEDFKQDTHTMLKRLCDFIGVEGVTDDIIAQAIAESSKDRMKQRIDVNEDQAARTVNIGSRDFKKWYSDDEKAFVNDVFSKYLKDDFGYKLTEW